MILGIPWHPSFQYILATGRCAWLAMWGSCWDRSMDDPLYNVGSTAWNVCQNQTSQVEHWLYWFMNRTKWIYMVLPSSMIVHDSPWVMRVACKPAGAPTIISRFGASGVALASPHLLSFTRLSSIIVISLLSARFATEISWRVFFLQSLSIW